MLTQSQAREIVLGSIRKVRKTSAKSVSAESETLEQIGIKNDDDSFRSLVTTIVADPSVGVSRLLHYLDPNDLVELPATRTLSIKDLIDRVQQLAQGKLCSNPHNPHPQECCPYPKTCPQCGYPVR